jgi:membrane-associated protein
MTEVALDLVTGWGWVVLFFATFLSCLAVPVPASFVMLAGGAFASTGDLDLAEVVLAPFVGAILGDNLGFWIGRRAGQRLTKLRHSAPGQRAAQYLLRRGTVAVYLSRWLFSPLGPYVNFLAGGAALPWRRFILADIAGEATWVGLYVALGYAFVGQISLIADALQDALGLLTALAVTALLAAELWRVSHRS